MKFLHTMLRVNNFDESIRFYTEVMGMNLLRTTVRPEQNYSLAFWHMVPAIKKDKLN